MLLVEREKMIVCPAICAVKLRRQGGVRPFGVSLMLDGYDDNGPQLYQSDRLGAYFADGGVTRRGFLNLNFFGTH